MDVTVGIVGLGSIGIRHARNFLSAGAQVMGWDPRPESRLALAALGGEVVDARSVVFDRADAIVVASPSRFHHADLIEAIRRGLHVFVEKPLAHTETDLAAVFTVADQSGTIVFAALNMRYHPAVSAARALFDRLGEPLWARGICASYLPEWRPGSDYLSNYAADASTGGVIFDLTHEFDLLNHLLGPAEVVAAAAQNSGLLGIESEDCADVILRHGRRIQSSLHLDYITRPRLRVTEVGFTEGLLRIDIRNRRLDAWAADGSVMAKQMFGGSVDDDYRGEAANFLACLRGEQRPACDGWEALGVLRQVLAARRMCGLKEEACL
ncbi:Gfo/Idh/MocA family oxidoreductase [Ferrovibrio sp.]|uniref:Gfo/Idh/MocA family protein n=1 Tax=Ferrovibrio sp. TaxID=1917215 RepID=UPI000CBA96C4|nr:Gfo/Idh/MocA family oxidoreductase [Ferrovibrio sp.]PJI41893.1 MAG: hypothetical protein CTR53_05395 [Ferrovibrio sp.]